MLFPVIVGVAVAHVFIYCSTDTPLQTLISRAIVSIAIALFVTTVVWFCTGSYVHYRRGHPHVKAKVIMPGEDEEDDDINNP